jgi:hypothetical protein
LPKCGLDAAVSTVMFSLSEKVVELWRLSVTTEGALHAV